MAVNLAVRVLIVEDDGLLAQALRQRIAALDGVKFCAVALDVETARTELDASHFDIALVDLVLPTVYARHDAAESNGRQLMQAIASMSPGTFVIMYSEFSNERVATELYEALNVRRPNILGAAEPHVFTSRPKSDPARAIADIDALVGRYRALKATVQFERYDEEVEVENCHAQLLRAFGATRDARAMRVTELRGGKSGAKVYSVTYFDRHGNVVLDTVAKCDLWERVSEEEAKFQKEVVGRLANGTYAPLLNTTPIMCGRFAAMFYERLDRSVGDLSGSWAMTSTEAVGFVNALKAIERSWSNASTVRETSIGDLRRMMIDDDKVAKYSSEFDLPWASVEAVTLPVRFCLQHGDLHAGNILLSENGSPYLLDFANIAELPACFDAVTLELAYIFNNPDRAASAWPQIGDVQRWASARDYFAPSPAAEILLAARGWAEQSLAGVTQNALYASAYAYTVRQVQYPDTDKDLLRELLNVLCARLLA